MDITRNRYNYKLFEMPFINSFLCTSVDTHCIKLSPGHLDNIQIDHCRSSTEYITILLLFFYTDYTTKLSVL